MPVLDKLESILAGNVADGVAKVISTVKADPTVVAQQHAELEKIQDELKGKIIDATTAEIQTAGEIIKTEAQSQSWLPRNVRPFLLMCWGIAITLHTIVPVIVRISQPNFTLPLLDPWVYKLAAIGYTGYVGFRTWEKLKDADN